MGQAVLGIDLGTSSVKVVIVAREGREILGKGSAPYPIEHPEPGAAEQDPERWWAATIDAVRNSLAEAGGRSEIEAIGVTGQMHGAVLLDAGKRLIANAIIWPDTRSAANAQAMMAGAGAEIIQIAGSPVAAGFQAATTRWLRRARPDLWKQTRHILLPKDYLRFRLTGVLATDPSDAAGSLLSDRRTRDWSPRLLELAGVPREFLPDIRPSTDFAGELTSEAAIALGLRPGLPVVTGAADAAAAALGSGVTSESDLLITLSTGSQVLVPRSTPAVDRQGRLHTFASALMPSEDQAGWYVMGATMSTGMAINWLRSQVYDEQDGITIESFFNQAAEAPIGANGLLFLPHLAGERSPRLNPLARGAYIGLTPGHSRSHLSRAALEGISLSIFDAYSAVREVIDRDPSTIVLAGGGSQSPLWCSMLADIFNLPVKRPVSDELTAYGAALLAFGAEELDHHEFHYHAPTEPSAERHRIYSGLFQVYCEANASLTGVFDRLACFQAES